jgi:CDP-4-dehydro-6-deoxyglucose reductase, E1
MFYELAAPNWGPEEYAAIERVVRSGQFTMADEVRRFEERFADMP